jgi:6-pyruvoyl-tetrahydropterin synthase
MAHRLWGGDEAATMPTKCRSIHGHSWAFVFVFGVLSTHRGISTDFGVLKDMLRLWLEPYDHCLLLVKGDPLIDMLAEMPEMRVVTLEDEPTTEHMAERLFFEVQKSLPLEFPIEGSRVYLKAVRVHETATNTATYGEV